MNALTNTGTDTATNFDLNNFEALLNRLEASKLEDAGTQERETIGKGASEQRTSAEQGQQFKDTEEARDYNQAQRGYRY